MDAARREEDGMEEEDPETGQGDPRSVVGKDASRPDDRALS